MGLTLGQQCVALGLPKPETEVLFHPVRKWRADYLWRAAKLIVEVDGGVFIGGRHARGAGIERDCEKCAEAMMLGYRVLHVTPRHVRNGRAVGWVELLLTGRRRFYPPPVERPAPAAVDLFRGEE